MSDSSQINHPSRMKELKAFLDGLGIADADLDLVNQALTHSSYSFEKNIYQDNERLEFLGDALLGLVTSHYLFEKYPDEDEGMLSKRKSRLVSRSMLGRQAKALGLGLLVRLGKGEEQSGGRRRSSLLGSALEALLGALYLSCFGKKDTPKGKAPPNSSPAGVIPALVAPYLYTFICNKIIRPSEKLLKKDVFADYKSRLQERVQKRHQCLPEYQLVSESGPDHQKFFRIEVFILGKSYGVGYGKRIKIAENHAAKAALENFK